ncbi:hypothetical protein DET1236 [Dehalococcoides mccartyi 195]|uniref:Uncharacterized protein n=1 Tax=Dehalococcoides mccartyi (strain ATCC BAA-2266 / KCTC 15142 / 195) TaxID=243164 RepID=Q3Z750_DEHM1|nr:hypothetical protein DET1236 [Dehalococcoides mccartyi 195]
MNFKYSAGHILLFKKVITYSSSYLSSRQSFQLRILGRLKLEMDKHPPEVFIVFFQPVVEFFNIGLGQKPENMFLELT